MSLTNMFKKKPKKLNNHRDSGKALLWSNIAFGVIGSLLIGIKTSDLGITSSFGAATSAAKKGITQHSDNNYFRYQMTGSRQQLKIHYQESESLSLIWLARTRLETANIFPNQGKICDGEQDHSYDIRFFVGVRNNSKKRYKPKENDKFQEIGCREINSNDLLDLTYYAAKAGFAGNLDVLTKVDDYAPAEIVTLSIDESVLKPPKPNSANVPNRRQLFR